MKRTIEILLRLVAPPARLAALLLAALAAGSAWAANPTAIASWSGDLANGSVKNTKYTMSADSTVVSFSNGSASLTSSTAVASTGVKIDWPNPTTDAESFTSKKMSVVIQYSDLSILNGNTSLLAVLWGANTKEYMIRTSADNVTAGIATNVTNSSSGTQSNPSSNYPAPTKGRLLAIFSGDSSCRPGMDLYFSTYNDSTGYGDYQRVAYWSDKKVDNGTFYGIKVGGTIAGTSAYYRPGMTVESVQLYDDVVSATAASMSSDMAWSDLVWDKDMLDLFPASLCTYIVNVTDNATLNLSDATIAAQSVVLNIASGKTLTLEGTATITGASISVTGGGKLKLNTSNPGCAITVASGGTMDIAVATVSCAINNNGTVNAMNCAFSAAIANYGTMNTSGTVSFSSSVNNTFYYGSTLNVSSGTTTYNSSSDRQLKGNVTIQKDATLVNAKHDALNYDANSSTPVNVYIYGTLTMSDNWTIGKGYNTLHLYDGSLINGTVNNALHFNTGVGVVIAETGDSVITAPFVKGVGTISIETKSGATLTVTSAPEIARRTGDGKLIYRVSNARWGGAPLPTNYDILERYSSTSGNGGDGNTETFLNSSFTGPLRVTTENNGYLAFAWVGVNSFNNPVFSGRPTLEANGDIRIYHSTSDKPFTVNNLSGSGYIKNFNTHDSNVNKYVDTLQTEDTTYAGIFDTNQNRPAGDPALTVRGAENASAIYSLTLSGANTTTGPLAIENNAKVVFASTGSWVGGTVTVKNGGVLESQNSESIAATLAVQEGATLKFANGVPLAATLYDWSTVTADESVKIDLTDVAPSATPVTLIASDVRVAASKFKVTASQRTATLSVDNGALKATFANFWTDGSWSGTPVANDNATLVLSQSSTLTVAEALTLGDITVENTSGGDVTLTVSGVGALTTGGWTIPAGVTVNTADGMSISGTVAGGGVINVPANTTLTMNGVTCSAKVTVEGTLRTTGTTNLSAANTSAANSLIEVVSDTTTLASKVSGIEGNITIAYGAELVAGKCWSPNDDDWYLEPIKPTGTTILDISGTLTLNTYIWYFGAGTTINLRSGASISGTGRSTTYGNLSWTGNGTLNCYANTTINAAIRTKADVSPVFNVADGVTLTIASAFVPQTSTADNFTGSGSLTKAGAGTLCLKNVAMTKPISGSEGTLQLLSDASGVKTHTATSSFSGKVIITRNTNGGHHEIGTSANDDSNPGVFFLSGSPELEINGTAAYMCLNRSFAGKYMTVKNLSATSGTIDAKYGTGGTSKTIRCLQTEDTTYAGNFNGENTTARYVDLLVYGQNETVKTLTLSGASGSMKSYGTLTVKDYGKVKFSGSGDWAAGTVVVGANGYLEPGSDATTLASALTLQDGATMTFVRNKMVTVTTFNLPSGEGEKVTFDINYAPALDGTTLISSASIKANTDVGMIECENAIIKAEEGAIKAYPVATLTFTANEVTTTTPCATVAAAYAAAYANELYGTGYDYITFYMNASFSAYTPSVKVKPAPGVTVTITSGSPEYGSYTAGTADENGVITYTAVPAPATYTWVGTSQGDWSTVGNWQYSDSEENLQRATRCPQAGDTVIFNDGAAVNHAAAVTVAGIEVNGNVTVSGTSSLETSGNVTGSGTLNITGNSSGIASAATGLTVSPNVVFGPGTYIACGTGGGTITFNGDVSLPSGTVSLWNAGHTFAGTTTFNGNFNNGGDQTLTLGAVTVAANTTLSGRISFGGAISIGSGITLTTPASNVSFSGASLVGSGTLSLGATLSEALTLASWTGTVVLPAVNSTPSDGFRFDWYGKSGSTVKIDKGFTAWLNASVADSYQVQPRLVINSAFTITGNNGGLWYNFAEISGTGTVTLNQSNTTHGFHILHLVDFSGKVNNNKNHQGTLTPFTVQKITLNSAPVAGQLLVESDTPDNIALSINGAHGVFVGNTKQDIIIEKKTDGIYVAATKSTETVDNETVTVLDTGSNTEIDATGVSGKVAIPGTVTQISGVDAENLLLKVTYTPSGESATTEYYSGILALDNSGNVSLNPSGTVTIADETVKVQPETAEDSPMTFTGSSPSFTVKAIPGLWYQVLAADSVNGGALVNPTGGKAVQATEATVSPAAPAFTGTVKYYKIAVGASQAALQ